MKKIMTYVLMLTYLTVTFRPVHAEQQDYYTELEAVPSSQSGGISQAAVDVSERQEREEKLAERQTEGAQEKKIRIIFNIAGILAVVGLLIWINAAEKKSNEAASVEQ